MYGTLCSGFVVWIIELVELISQTRQRNEQVICIAFLTKYKKNNNYLKNLWESCKSVSSVTKKSSDESDASCEVDPIYR